MLLEVKLINILVGSLKFNAKFKKIALLSYRSDPFSGGQGIYIKNLSDALLDRGHEITIFLEILYPKLIRL